VRTTTILILLTLVALGLSPAASPRDSARSDPRPVADGGNAFAVDIYRALKARPGNLFLSPYSISAALTMTRLGAAGETAKQMDEVLHLPEGAAAGHKALAAALRPRTVTDGYGRESKKVPTHELHIANALWGQEGMPLKSPFLSNLRNSFGAPLERIDFRNTAKARKIINDWVATNTKDRIRDIIPPDLPTPDTRLALANAIYFKASWRHPFSERGTRIESFTNGAGAVVEVPTMSISKELGYAETADVQILELPYRADETSMVVVLPKEKDGLPALEEKLTAKGMAAMLEKIATRPVDVRLPKFSFTTALDLTAVLPAMGMPDAFDGGKADFSEMTDAERLYIGAVLHKAFVAVDEAGTEAAAATVVMMRKGGAPGVPVEFRADHPFLFLIRHRPTGCILFLGRVDDPSVE
jgi:serpin B